MMTTDSPSSLIPPLLPEEEQIREKLDCAITFGVVDEQLRNFLRERGLEQVLDPTLIKAVETAPVAEEEEEDHDDVKEEKRAEEERAGQSPEEAASSYQAPEDGIDLGRSLKHQHLFSLPHQGNPYSTTSLPTAFSSRDSVGERIVCACASQGPVVVAMEMEPNERGSLTPRTTELQPANLSSVEVLAVHAFYRNHRRSDIVIALAYVRTHEADSSSFSFSSPPPSPTPGLAVYSYPRPPYTVGAVMGVTSDDVEDDEEDELTSNCDVDLMLAQGGRCAWSDDHLSFHPHHLTHADAPVGNLRARGVSEQVLVVCGGDRRVHVLARGSEAGTWGPISMERHFPELKVEFPSVPRWINVKYLDRGFVRRMTAVGLEDGSTHLSLVVSAPPSFDPDPPEVVASWTHRSPPGSGAVTSLGLFFRRRPEEEEEELRPPVWVARHLPRRGERSHFYEDYDLSGHSDVATLDLVVTTATAPARVFSDVVHNGFGKAQCLPCSAGYDVVSCSLATDVDADGDVEVVVGTAGGRLLVYKERRQHGGPRPGEWQLVWTHRLRHPVHSVLAADLTGDGVKEVCVRTARGVHVFQHDVAMLKELRLRRLKRLLEAKERSSQAAQEAQ